MRALAFLTMLVLTGCSLVLGIDDPKPRGAGDDDGGVHPDVMTTSTDILKFSPTDVTVAQGQTVRVHVVLMHQDGTMGDVTGGVTYTSDNETVAKIGGLGLINSGLQTGSAMITASNPPAMPATLKLTTTAVACHPVINELMTGSAVSGSDEFIEIYNPCTAMVNVAGWTLNYRGPNTTGAQDANGLITLTGQMDPGTFRLYGGATYMGVHDDTFTNGLGAADGAIGLRAGPKDTGALVDSIAYGNVTLTPKHPFIETSPLAGVNIGQSASRKLFDGNDSNDNASDFASKTTPTPGKLNVP